jgi:hypothetical protein
MQPKYYLESAKFNKSDEFRTSLVDIEAELNHYRCYFNEKRVYLNTDNPASSEFFWFFIRNFNGIKSKKFNFNLLFQSWIL